MNDALGDRIKGNYEDRSKTFLTRRTNTIFRIDGKAFHTYTRGLEKPFDEGLMEDMSLTTIKLCEAIQGAKMAYTQSDEISILVTDYDQLQTDAWFDGNVQKMCSVSASIATAAFNEQRVWRTINECDPQTQINGMPDTKFANFDSRVFTIPEKEEVANYFLWRCQDAARNSVQMFARFFISHKELEGKSIPDIHEMLHQKGENWAKLPPQKKRGQLILRTGEGKDTNWTNVAIPDTYGFEYWNNLVQSVTKCTT